MPLALGKDITSSGLNANDIYKEITVVVFSEIFKAT